MRARQHPRLLPGARGGALLPPPDPADGRRPPARSRPPPRPRRGRLRPRISSRRRTPGSRRRQASVAARPGWPWSRTSASMSTKPSCASTAARARSRSGRPTTIPPRSASARPWSRSRRWERFPQSNISGVQAQQACEGAGKRLCTDAEWLRACRGAADNIYPYGDTRDPRRLQRLPRASPGGRLFRHERELDLVDAGPPLHRATRRHAWTPRERTPRASATTGPGI